METITLNLNIFTLIGIFILKLPFNFQISGPRVSCGRDMMYMYMLYYECTPQ